MQNIKRSFLSVLLGASLGLSVSLLARADEFPRTDAAKMADALRAGPDFITKNATILDWPSKAGGAYRVLRKGTNEWSCLPGVPLYPHDEPGCFDAAFFSWLKQSLDGKTPKIDRVGVAYMYTGAWVPDLAHVGPPSDDHTFHVGPHVMIVTPHNEDLVSFSHDGSNGQMYVAHLPNRKGLYLVMPFKEWSDIQMQGSMSDSMK